MGYTVLQGWDPNADDMAAVVAIHNSVNERAWQEVMVWERLHSSECAEPRLKKFMGRPSDYSPKARLLNFVVGLLEGLQGFKTNVSWGWVGLLEGKKGEMIAQFAD